MIMLQLGGEGGGGRKRLESQDKYLLDSALRHCLISRIHEALLVNQNATRHELLIGLQGSLASFERHQNVKLIR
jgi:hypothetical protein